MKQPLISVCVATFNHERYISDCLMSIIAQEVPGTLEILVGDDNSGDATKEVVTAVANRFPDVIFYRCHQPQLGAAANYQSLVQQARGRYIAHCDGDDFWLPGKLSAQIAFMENHPDCPAVYSNTFTIADDGCPLGVFNNFQPARFGIADLVRHGNFLNQSSVLYRAVLREVVLALPAPFIDYRMHLRFARSGAVGYLNRALVGYRVGSTSSMVMNAGDQVRQLYWDALLDVPAGSVPAIDRARGMADFARSAAFAAVRLRSLVLVRKWLPIVFRSSPVGGIRMAWLITAVIARAGVRRILVGVCQRVGGNAPYVLYRRP
ncbi:glycosyltransferase [uncultured Thiodictyon sp.]|uniref:glycosyltransferase n=1 Tax=uncultured Thiodictyon sp. TaxID=1846217 RepID=UPI0025FABFD1|nr:glycosyltransferase [uncultured Thiodictyon sp.]